MTFIRNEKDIIAFIQEDEWMVDLLTCAKSLNLPDWWICAGFVRSKIWDVQHGFDERTAMRDIDVIYYDPENNEESFEKKHEDTLKGLLSTAPWSVKNQARMHIANNSSPYSSSVDAIEKFPETATALGVKLDEKDHVILVAPHGIQDAVNLLVKPTPYFLESKDRMLMYQKRVREKNWQAIWSDIEVMNLDLIK
ncbi:nucleotidyltransferase family protein [Sporosarcina sp. YIM B06819]|uniref:nucleotidyltransferase family protein n=1 Tax=Sporosarcina sp. YIM B06819 TaxID=3081769 RepID=UPI00298D4AFB|nr:nucleotidyltransferase family protein [Sporosarcina sp. YIM B06819]